MRWSSIKKFFEKTVTVKVPNYYVILHKPKKPHPYIAPLDFTPEAIEWFEQYHIPKPMVYPTFFLEGAAYAPFYCRLKKTDAMLFKLRFVS